LNQPGPPGEPSHAQANGQFIGGKWRAGAGEPLRSINPAEASPCWHGRYATEAEAREALAAARDVFSHWCLTPIDQRIEILERYASLLQTHRQTLASIISQETGKPRWEATGEVGAMINKVPITLEAMRARRPMEGAFAPCDPGEVTRYKPLGVLVVLGPFNLPGHLPNGHIVPALLAGNTIVLKPSDRTPWTAAYLASLLEQAGVPSGVVNVVQGGGQLGTTLVNEPEHDGVLLTGSLKAGLAVRRALVDQPQRILALEMGGNNPLIVDDTVDPRAAAVLTIQSAFLTAGQRCTCARRLIVPAGEAGDRFLDELIRATGKLSVGKSDSAPPPFMGPVIDSNAADAVIEAHGALVKQAGRSLIEPTQPGPTDAFVKPGVIDVSNVSARGDEEVFGPLLQVIRTRDFDAAIEEANDTKYGLVAGLLSNDADRYRHVHQRVGAGLINWNKPTTGASSRLPFGGIGMSGNHRPSGAFAIDYCTYPVASLENAELTLPEAFPYGLHIDDHDR
jgi:succinylglutamic semialdehyde dehydrogenase